MKWEDKSKPVIHCWDRSEQHLNSANIKPIALGVIDTCLRPQSNTLKIVLNKENALSYY